MLSDLGWLVLAVGVIIIIAASYAWKQAVDAEEADEMVQVGCGTYREPWLQKWYAIAAFVCGFLCVIYGLLL